MTTKYPIKTLLIPAPYPDIALAIVKGSFKIVKSYNESKGWQLALIQTFNIFSLRLYEFARFFIDLPKQNNLC